MHGISDYVAVYDISSNKERSRVDTLLKGYGFRVQESVFECRMNKRLKEELVTRLGALHITTGFVKLYRLEYTLSHAIVGNVPEGGPDTGHAFIV